MALAKKNMETIEKKHLRNYLFKLHLLENKIIRLLVNYFNSRFHNYRNNASKIFLQARMKY